MNEKVLKDLQVIPGVGKIVAQDLYDLGIRKVADLKGLDPEKLYNDYCSIPGNKIDRCVLYVFREAVYFASHKVHDPKKLKWWYWKDK
jgi:hypothetical protein